MSSLQDDDHRADQTDPPNRRLFDLARPEAGIFPRPFPSKLPEVPWLLHRRPEVPLQGSSLRVQLRSGGLHTTVHRRSSLFAGKGRLGSGLPGRLVSLDGFAGMLASGQGT